MYAGRLWSASRPFRRKGHAQTTSFDFYPYKLWPPFIAAGASLISKEVVEALLIIAKYTKFVPFDDVFYGKCTKFFNLYI